MQSPALCPVQLCEACEGRAHATYGCACGARVCPHLVAAGRDKNLQALECARCTVAR